MRLKGPVFPSYLNQNVVPKKIRGWEPGLHSERQQLKNLRLRCQNIIDSRDPAILAVGRRVIQSVLDEPNPEFGALHLMAKGLDCAEDTGVSWVMAMTYLMDRFDGKVIEIDTGEWICGCGVTCGAIRLICDACGMHRTAERRIEDATAHTSR